MDLAEKARKHERMAQQIAEAAGLDVTLVGVSVGRWEDKASWRVNLPDDATDEQREAAQAVIDAFDPDAPERRLVAKATILDRLTDAQLTAALGAMTARQKERWRMPGHPDVYADDAELLALLQYVGADPEAVLAP